MLLIAVLPPLIYLCLQLLFGLILLHAYRRRGSRQAAHIDRGAFLLALTTLVLSCLPLYFTWQRSISREACLSGIFGILGLLGVAAVIALTLTVGYARTPAGLLATLRANLPFVLTALASCGLSWLIFTRSALLCTV